MRHVGLYYIEQHEIRRELRKNDNDTVRRGILQEDRGKHRQEEGIEREGGKRHTRIDWGGEN